MDSRAERVQFVLGERSGVHERSVDVLFVEVHGDRPSSSYHGLAPSIADLERRPDPLVSASSEPR